MDSQNEEHNYGLVCSFWIDTDAYSDRDRGMFVAGYEFAGIVERLRHDADLFEMTIHRENESRTRMAAGKFGKAGICTKSVR